MLELFPKQIEAEPGSYLIHCTRCRAVFDLLDADGLGGGEDFVFCPKCGRKTANKSESEQKIEEQQHGS